MEWLIDEGGEVKFYHGGSPAGSPDGNGTGGMCAMFIL